MSNKSTYVRARGDCKPVTTLSQVVGQRMGKSFEAAAYEIMDEMSVYPPVTPEEAEAFCRIRIKRCNMNLANAKDRGDKRAVIHLERKLAVYEYLINLVHTKTTPVGEEVET